MFDVNTFLSDSIDFRYLLRKFVLELHAVIRIFDKDGQLLEKYGMLEEENDPVLQDTAFLQQLLTYGWKDCPGLYYEYEYVVYVTIRMSGDCRMIIGPVSLRPVTADLNKLVIKAHQMKPEGGFRLSYCSREYFFASMLSIFHLLTGQKKTIDEVWERNFMNREMKNRLEQNLMETIIHRQNQEAAHTPHNQEMLEMKCIREGDGETLRQTIKEPVTGQRGLVSTDPVRQAKDVAISVITLASRSAISGGIHPEIAFTMVESLAQPEQIETVMREAEYKLADMVKQQKTKDELPHPIVGKVKDYIFRNLQSEIKVSDMAEKFAVNADYLSFLFHKNTGKTISRYVLEEKVKAAQSMLIYTDNSLQEIAFSLNFSSQSHFSTVFRKIAGVTPREYRESYTMNTGQEVEG
jgi:AraC-like DNA-binding protein